MHRALRSSLFCGLAALAGLASICPPLAAQHDSAMMGKDSAMMQESGMKKDHDEMMGHEAMEPNMMFMGAAGHKAAGDYEITEASGKQQIKLTADFAVDKAPDLYLVLAGMDHPDAQSVYVAKLNNATGAQTYDVPKGTDLSKFSKLLIWSKKSNTLIASADLARSGHMMQMHK